MCGLSETSGPHSTNRHVAHQTSTQKWDNIFERCYELGISRSSNRCSNKWEQMRSDFKKVYDYESDIPSGRPSFWFYLEGEAKKLFKLKTIMKKEVYDQFASWFPQASRDIQSKNLMDTTTFNNPQRGIQITSLLAIFLFYSVYFLN